MPTKVHLYDVNMVHGGWNNAIDEYVMPSETYFSGFCGKYFASGHTHIPCIWQGTDKVYCNPGSVGQPRDGDPRASYALWDGHHFTLHRINYDIAATQKAMAFAGFDSYYYQNLSRGLKIGSP